MRAVGGDRSHEAHEDLVRIGKDFCFYFSRDGKHRRVLAKE